MKYYIDNKDDISNVDIGNNPLRTLWISHSHQWWSAKTVHKHVLYRWRGPPHCLSLRWCCFRLQLKICCFRTVYTRINKRLKKKLAHQSRSCFNWASWGHQKCPKDIWITLNKIQTVPGNDRKWTHTDICLSIFVIKNWCWMLAF